MKTRCAVACAAVGSIGLGAPAVEAANWASFFSVRFAETQVPNQFNNLVSNNVQYTGFTTNFSLLSESHSPGGFQRVSVDVTATPNANSRTTPVVVRMSTYGLTNGTVFGAGGSNTLSMFLGIAGATSPSYYYIEYRVSYAGSGVANFANYATINTPATGETLLQNVIGAGPQWTFGTWSGAVAAPFEPFSWPLNGELPVTFFSSSSVGQGTGWTWFDMEYRIYADTSPIPAPSAAALLGLGGLMAARRRP